VQAKRAANAVVRLVRLRGSAAILTGRFFDDRGNRMSPTHANKCGVRYRYYVSHAILQNQRVEAGSVARVPAPEIETLVCEGIRRHLAAMGDGEPATATADRDLIERHVARVIVKPQALDVCLIPTSEASAQTEDPSLQDPAPCHPPIPTITLPWTAPIFAAVKGIIHAPGAKPAMRPESRDALLTAIAKARGWIDDIRLGRITSFAETAEHEAQGERHIRLLAPLAFLSNSASLPDCRHQQRTGSVVAHSYRAIRGLGILNAPPYENRIPPLALPGTRKHSFKAATILARAQRRKTLRPRLTRRASGHNPR
jgi:site-specific DNA recombinase